MTILSNDLAFIDAKRMATLWVDPSTRKQCHKCLWKLKKLQEKYSLPWNIGYVSAQSAESAIYTVSPSPFFAFVYENDSRRSAPIHKIHCDYTRMLLQFVRLKLLSSVVPSAAESNPNFKFRATPPQHTNREVTVTRPALSVSRMSLFLHFVHVYRVDFVYK